MSALVPVAPIACAQRWVLAIPWHAVMRWNASWDRFGLVARPARSADAALALERHFAIVTRLDVERTLASLMASANVKDAAWHLSNAVLVAELALSAYLMDEARAWQAAVDAARALQRHHRGWFSMAEAYLRGLGANRPDSPDPAAREFLIDLHARPDSPWNTLAWNTELPDKLPPPLDHHGDRVVEIGDTEALQAALADSPGARLRLAPGVYRGSFTLRDQVLERAEHAPVGSVVLEAEGGPALVTEGGVLVRGIILRDGEPGQCALSVGGSFVRVEDCRFEGGTCGIDMRPPAPDHLVGTPSAEPLVQLDALAFEGLSDSAVTLVRAACRARDVAIGAVGGSGFSLEATRLHLEDAFIESAERAGIIARGGEVHLRRVRVHDAERWGIALVGGAHAELEDVEAMRGVVGLFAAEGAVVHAARCRFADAATANVELLDIASARFSDCHMTGGDWTGVWLHPGTGAVFRGGQIGGSRQACLMVEGGREVALSGVGIGPSREGGGLFIAGQAEVHADGVFVSGAALAGVELRKSRLVAADLRVRGSVEGVLVRDGARLDAHRLDLAEIRGTGLWLAAGSAAVAGLGLRKAGFGIVVAADAAALVQHLVCAYTPVAVQVEGGRLALAGRVTLGGGAVRVRGGRFAARGLAECALSASDAELHLEAISAQSARAIDVQGRSRVVLVGAQLAPGAMTSSPTCELIIDPTSSPVSVMSPLLVGLVSERYTLWGATATPALLHRVARTVITRLGLDALTLRETSNGVRIDGPLGAIARFAPALEALFDEPGALGVTLASLLSGPRTPNLAPRGLA